MDLYTRPHGGLPPRHPLLLSFYVLSGTPFEGRDLPLDDSTLCKGLSLGRHCKVSHYWQCFMLQEDITIGRLRTWYEYKTDLYANGHGSIRHPFESDPRYGESRPSELLNNEPVHAWYVGEFCGWVGQINLSFAILYEKAIQKFSLM